MSEQDYLDKAVEAGRKAGRAVPLTPVEGYLDAVLQATVKAVAPHIEANARAGEQRQLLECEEALRTVERNFAEFRASILEPLRDEGRSIEALSWDELLGVAVRNANEAMKQADRADTARAQEQERLEAALLSDEAVGKISNAALEHAWDRSGVSIDPEFFTWIAYTNERDEVKRAIEEVIARCQASPRKDGELEDGGHS